MFGMYIPANFKFSLSHFGKKKILLILFLINIDGICIKFVANRQQTLFIWTCYGFCLVNVKLPICDIEHLISFSSHEFLIDISI